MSQVGTQEFERLGEAELVQWLSIAQLPRLSTNKFATLVTTHELLLADLFAASNNQLQTWGLTTGQRQLLVSPNQEYIDSSLQWLNAGASRYILPFQHPYYSKLLRETARPPLLLYCHGNIKLLNSRQIGIVGSRNPSASGKQNVAYFTKGLVQCGWVITSGLAIGIDGLAHYATLQAKGHTIAVLGSGIDQVYPRRHHQLAQEIIDNGGLIVSEFAPGTPARAENFPRRNRIISGLAYGTLIIEAALKSGSLITARFALEQDREVFAVPGNIHNPLAKGCHYLIKQGAKLVETLDDINEEFQHLDFARQEKVSQKRQKICMQSLASDTLLDSVDFETTPLDIVAQRCHMPVAEVMSQLLEYELRGLVTAVPGGYLKLGDK